MAASTSTSARGKGKRKRQRQRPEYWDGECPVCLEEADDDTELLVAPCGHVFCAPCLHAALRCACEPGGKRRCPCRGPCPTCRAPTRRANARASEVDWAAVGRRQRAEAAALAAGEEAGGSSSSAPERPRRERE